MIKISTTDGNTSIWQKENYTDYKYEGKVFVVIKDGKWIGIYNMDCVKKIVITD